MENKVNTVRILKEKRDVPEHVTEGRKKYVQRKKTILEALKDASKTIPQISLLTGIPSSEVTYYLLSFLKFGDVSVEGVDDTEEYYLYQLKK